MKVIDLLNRIANGEEVPKKIHYNCVPLYWCEPCKIYETMTDGGLCGKDLYTLLDNLNDEVEIIEEDNKIEKLEIYKEIDDLEHYANILKVSKNGEYEINEALSVVVDKINEIIDKLNEEEK